MRPCLAFVTVFASLFAAAPAFALSQPGSDAGIPSPMGCNGGKPTGLPAVMACACTTPGICNIGAACPGGSTTCDNGQNGTCETTLWHSPNDNSCIPSNESGLDPSTQAAITPETFHPTCGQTFTVISRGTAMFQDIFGWYNATTNNQPPDPSDLHVMVGCTNDTGFTATLDLATAPGYKGGDIGFFLISPEDHNKGGSCAAADGGADCCPSVARFQAGQGYVYYSQRELNPDNSPPPPYFHLLILPSDIFPERYYFAWEDTFHTTSSDFTDIVVAVDGVQCSGAGVPCDTGKKGACAMGVMKCVSGATTPTCQDVITPQPETCNGVDDDCDGVVDNGATCSPASDICVDGTCVEPCGGNEFPCPTGTACDPVSKACIAPACIGVTCTSDQACRAGTCVAACSGVVCPHGQTCVNDVCVDLCANVKCGAGEVCGGGLCLPGCTACGGITCTSPLSCDQTSGDCVDTSCTSACPSGQYCSSGSCVDSCQGVSCPGGGACANGQCPSTVKATADAGTTKIQPGGTDAGTSKKGVDAGSKGTDGGVHNGDFGAGSAQGGCSTLGPDPDRVGYAGALLAAIALGGVVTRRRRGRSA